MQSAEVLESLQSIRGQVEAHLRNVKEYRAFLAIQVAMDEISHVGELHSPLEDVCEGVRARLNETREYRALLAVEKSIADIAGVLGLLDEINPRPVPAPLAVEPSAAHTTTPEATGEAQAGEQSAAQPEAAPQPEEAVAETAAPEVAQQPQQPIEVAAVSDATEVTAETTSPAATAETPSPEISAPEAAEIIVPAEIAAEGQPTFEATLAAVENHAEPQPAFEAPPAEATEAPAPLDVAAESNLESQPFGFGAGQAQQQPHQAVSEHDQDIAKVA
jgi:hypothetical protein